jgi:hypothetical protein
MRAFTTGHDPAVSGILAYGILARLEPSEMPREAQRAVKRMTPDELRNAYLTAKALYEAAELEITFRQL